MLELAILGHGVVGSGVAEVIEKNKSLIKLRTGKEIKLKRILDLLEFKDLPYSNIFTKNFDDILNDDDISIVVETMGGLNPSFDYVKDLLERKKNVVTSNKELVCKKGTQLLEIARKNGVNFLFEASVGGGMPIVGPLKNYLASNEIESIVGILNGTTNFILTEMVEKNSSFAEALSLAQNLGYAEKDPSADVEGIDSLRKICILGSLVCGKEIAPFDVYVKGIDKVEIEDVCFAKSMGFSVKLVASVKFKNGKVEVFVRPVFVSAFSKLFLVEGVLNGVVVKGDAIGELFFTGAGAGKLPTATAILADVVDLIRADGKNISAFWEKTQEGFVEDYRNYMSKFYFRFEVEDVLKAKDFILKNYSSPVFVSPKEQKDSEVLFTTDEMTEGKVEDLAGYFMENGIVEKARFKILDC